MDLKYQLVYSKIVFQRSWAFSVWAEAISSISSLLLVPNQGSRHHLLPVPQFVRWQHCALALELCYVSEELAVSKVRVGVSNLRLEGRFASLMPSIPGWHLLRVLHFLTKSNLICELL